MVDGEERRHRVTYEMGLNRYETVQKFNETAF